MANALIARIAILACIFLGELLAIFATAGKEWEKFEKQINSHYRYYYPHVVNYEEFILGYNTGLWEYCTNEEDDLGIKTTRCVSVNDELRRYESSMKGNYFFI